MRLSLCKTNFRLKILTAQSQVLNARTFKRKNSKLTPMYILVNKGSSPVKGILCVHLCPLIILPETSLPGSFPKPLHQGPLCQYWLYSRQIIGSNYSELDCARRHNGKN